MNTQNMNTRKITKYSFFTMIFATLLATASVGNFYSQNYDLKGQLTTNGYLKPYVQMETNKEDSKENKNA